MRFISHAYVAMDLTPKVTMVLNIEREGKVPLTSLGEPSKFPQTGLTAKVTSAPGSAAALASEMDDNKRVMIEYISRKMEMVSNFALVVIYSFVWWLNRNESDPLC